MTGRQRRQNNGQSYEHATKLLTRFSSTCMLVMARSLEGARVVTCTAQAQTTQSQTIQNETSLEVEKSEAPVMATSSSRNRTHSGDQRVVVVLHCVPLPNARLHQHILITALHIVWGLEPLHRPIGPATQYQRFDQCRLVIATVPSNSYAQAQCFAIELKPVKGRKLTIALHTHD